MEMEPTKMETKTNSDETTDVEADTERDEGEIGQRRNSDVPQGAQLTSDSPCRQRIETGDCRGSRSGVAKDRDRK